MNFAAFILQDKHAGFLAVCLINVVIGIIGLVLTAIAVGITIGKKNRH